MRIIEFLGSVTSLTFPKTLKLPLIFVEMAIEHANVISTHCRQRSPTRSDTS